MKQKPLSEIMLEIGKWAAYNFDVHASVLGMCEESGEVAHCILKRKQKIRSGSEGAEKANEALKDAIADAAIYALHHTYKVTIENTTYLPPEEGSEELLLSCLLQSAGRLLVNPGSGFEYGVFWSALSQLAELHGWKLEDIINEVWSEVKKRDWRKFPKNGLTE